MYMFHRYVHAKLTRRLFGTGKRRPDIMSMYAIAPPQVQQMQLHMFTCSLQPGPDVLTAEAWAKIG